MSEALFKNWRTTIIGIIALVVIGLAAFEQLDQVRIDLVLGVLGSLGLLAAKDGSSGNGSGETGRNLNYILLISAIPLLMSSGCVSGQKFIYDTAIYKGMSIAEEKIPKFKEITLSYDSLSNGWKAEDKLFVYQILNNDSTKTLSRFINYLEIANLLIEEGHKIIEEYNLKIRQKKERKKDKDGSGPPKKESDKGEE